MKKGTLVGLLIGLVIACVFAVIAINTWAGGSQDEAVHYETRTLSNMSVYKNQIYAGVNGIYGVPIVQESSIFTIQEDKIYFVEKITQAHESMTDTLLPIYRANLDGSERELLVSDVFLPGSGHEKVVGDKLFYVYGYNDAYGYRYAYYDLTEGKRKEILSERVENILGYDGTYVYYSGMDNQEQLPILGRISLKNNKDEILYRGGSVDEEGYMESVVFWEGKFYCLTLTEKNDSHDYRTYTYRLLVRSSKNGALEKELPITFTGSANYSFYIGEDAIYCSIDQKILCYPDGGEGEGQVLAQMDKAQYWGIIHFLPGDGYLYYEAIAQPDEKTGNNDYFYRVPKEGGIPQLLKEWFTM